MSTDRRLERALLIRKPPDIRPSEITSKENYLNRRQFMAAGAAAGINVSPAMKLAMNRVLVIDH